MRLHFALSPNTQTVPFDYQHFLTGAFHQVAWRQCAARWHFAIFAELA